VSRGPHPIGVVFNRLCADYARRPRLGTWGSRH